MERLKCREKRPNIVQWYLGALGGSGWKIVHSDEANIFCTKDGSNCSISVMGVDDKGYHAYLTITSFAKN